MCQVLTDGLDLKSAGQQTLRAACRRLTAVSSVSAPWRAVRGRERREPRHSDYKSLHQSCRSSGAGWPFRPPPKLGPEVNSIIPHIRQSLVWRRDNWTSQPSSAFLKIVARDLSSWGSLTTNAPRSWETRASILKGLGSGEPCKIHYISSVFFSHGNHSGYFLLLNCIWLFPPLSQVVIWYQKNHLSFWGQKEYNLFGILGTKICCRLTSICQLWWYCMELAQVSCAMGLCRIRSQQTAQKHIGLPQSCCLSMPSHPNLLWIFPIKFQRYHRKEKLILLRVYVPHLSVG